MDLSGFAWKNETQFCEIENGIQIYAPAETDYFVNPADGAIKANAPFFYREVEGDFVFRANVSHGFSSTYDACVLLALDHDTLWAKACFEYTDFQTHAVVTVMTDGRSDDANGANIDGNEVWLQLARKGDLFAVHYSFNGREFIMARICSLSMGRRIKVGLVAQSPVGSGGERKFLHVLLEQRTLADIRSGNA